MKISAFLIIGFLFFTAHTTQAQSPVVFKYKLDNSYSVHNYKHPNKGAIASKYNLDRLVTFSYINPSPALELRQRNYKSQFFTPKTEESKSGAIIPVPATKKTMDPTNSPNNYKRQFR